MPGLPIELWEHIIHYLRDFNDLRAVTEVCRTFHALSAPLYWSMLNVSGGDSSISFSKISSSPHLAQHVKRIRFHGAGCETHLLRISSEDMEHVRVFTLPDCQAQLHTMKDLVWCTGQLPGLFRTSIGLSKVRAVCWQAPWARLSDLVHFHLSNGLRTDLTTFPKLTSVETSTAVFLQWDKTKDPIAAHQRARTEYPRFAAAETPSKFLLFNELLRGAQIMAASISQISICKLQELLALHWGGTYFGTAALCNVNHLKIDLSASTWKNSKEYGDCLAKQILLSTWLRSVQRLETLTLLQNPRMEPAINALGDLKHFLKAQPFKRIELVNITTYPVHLEEFIDSHSGHLESLRIREPVMWEDGWRQFRSAILVKWHSIQDLDIGDTYKPQDMSQNEWDKRSSTIITRGP